MRRDRSISEDPKVTVRVLKLRRDVLADEAKHLQVELEYRQSAIASLDAVLGSLVKGYKPASPPWIRRKSNILFTPGQRSQAIYAVLRVAKAPLPLQEVVAGVLRNGGVSYSHPKAVEDRTRDGLIYLVSQGRITKLGHGCSARWVLKRKATDSS